MTIATDTQAEPETRNHPLQNFQLRSISTVDIWLRSWNATYILEHRLGMLDMVFELEDSTKDVTLIAVLLDLADHWYEQKFFLPPNAAPFSLLRSPEMILARKRQSIAIKAMQQLCKHVFGMRISDGEVPSWAALCLRPGIAEKILRLYEPSNGVIECLQGRYCSSSDMDGLIQPALRNFAGAFWRMFWELGGSRRNLRDRQGMIRRLSDDEAAVYVHLQTLRPRLIPLIEELGELHQLIKGNYRPDPAMLQALRAYALRPIGLNPHQPASLKEILFRSPAAQVVYLLDAINVPVAEARVAADAHQRAR